MKKGKEDGHIWDMYIKDGIKNTWTIHNKNEKIAEKCSKVPQRTFNC